MSSLFYDIYRGKRVLVTGATGFKGSWLSIWLQKLGAKVIGYSLEPQTSPSMFKICKLEGELENIIGDIRDEQNLEKVFYKYKPEIVFHLAAQPLVRQSYKNPRETYETNVMGTVNLLETARTCDCVKQVIVITSDKCYENKELDYEYNENDSLGGYDPYSSSKGCAELIVAAYRNSFFEERGIALSSARAGNVIGGGDWAEDRLIPDFVRSITLERPVIIRNPSAVRPWQFVLEPLSGYLWLGALMAKNKDKYCCAWNFGPLDNDSLTVEELLTLAIDFWGKGSIKIDSGRQPHEAKLLKLDISKAQSYLYWSPVYDINKAMYRTIQWYKAFYENENMFSFSLKQIEEYEKELQTRQSDLGLRTSDAV